jgi:ethanolamine utilization protein EutQ
MHSIPEGITRFTPGDVETWYRSGERRIFLSDVVDARNGETMSVGFARYAPGESNAWLVTYDEALIVTKGVFTVTSADGIETTARAGEVIFLRKGTRVVYSAKAEGAEVVYVTYPHWMKAQEESEHAAFLDTFHPSEEAPAPIDNVALLRSIWGPLERGESHDFGPFFDALAAEVTYETAVGELRGKQALIHYFAPASATIEFNPFEKPLEYYGEGDRVVILGDETFKVKDTGATHRAEWAWVIDVYDGLITRILHLQDLSPIDGPVRAALVEAQTSAKEPAAGSR